MKINTGLSCLFVIFFLNYCAGIQEKKTNKDITDSIVSGASKKSIDSVKKDLVINKRPRYKNLDSISCDSLLTLLVLSSSLDTMFKKGLSVVPDGVIKGVLSIKITRKNEFGDDKTFALLDFDMGKKQLNDVTASPDHPTKLQYDSIIFNSITKNCRLVE